MEWREIPGYERYKVSENGQITGVSGKLMALGHDGKKRKRPKITMWINGKGVTRSVHRLVALAFVPNPNNLPQVNHKDGDTNNNHYSNLEWCTNFENAKHAYKNKLMGVFKQSDFKILNDDEIIAIRNYPIPKGLNGSTGNVRNEICKKFGVSIHVVKDIRSKRSWGEVK